MTGRAHSISQLDLFVPALSDIQLRDQREVMERPFFIVDERAAPPEFYHTDGERADPDEVQELLAMHYRGRAPCRRCRARRRRPAEASHTSGLVQ